MAFKEVMSKLGRIYRRNVKGYFRTLGEIVSGEYKGSNKVAPAAFMLSSVLLPLNLTVFALFKSCFDLYTRRNEIPKEDRAALIEKLDQISEAKPMNDLVQTISAYKAKSHSSRQLITALQDTSDVAQKNIDERCSHKERELQEDQFTFWPTCSLLDVDKRVKKVTLDESKKTAYEAFCNQVSSRWDMPKITDQKKLITDFLKDPNTPGKAMEREIQEFFRVC